MQPNCVLLLLVLCTGSALGAPSDTQPGDKSLDAAAAAAPASAPAAPASAAALASAAAPASAAAAAPASAPAAPSSAVAAPASAAAAPASAAAAPASAAAAPASAAAPVSAAAAPASDAAALTSAAAAQASADPDVAIQKSLKKVREQLQDAVTAFIAKAAEPAGQTKALDPPSVTIPEISIKPVEITANKKYAEIVGQFIADLIQIPIVLLHAFGEAISGLTGSKQPLLVFPGSASSSAGAVQTPSPYKAE